MRTVLWTNGHSTGADMGKMRGRKRKEGEREPNGRLSRSLPDAAEIRENQSTVMAYRQRVFGLSERDAKDQRAATYIGRLSLAYEAGERVLSLSIDQYHAALDYKRDYHNLQIALGGQTDYVESRDLWSLSGEPDPIKREQKFIAFCVDARERWAKRQKAIQEHVMTTGCKVGIDFLNLCVLKDIPNDAIVPYGRELLNSLIGNKNITKAAA